MELVIRRPVNVGVLIISFVRIKSSSFESISDEDTLSFSFFFDLFFLLLCDGEGDGEGDQSTVDLLWPFKFDKDAAVDDFFVVIELVSLTGDDEDKLFEIIWVTVLVVVAKHL